MPGGQPVIMGSVWPKVCSRDAILHESELAYYQQVCDAENKIRLASAVAEEAARSRWNDAARSGGLQSAEAICDWPILNLSILARRWIRQ